MTKDRPLRITVFYCANCLDHSAVVACWEDDSNVAIKTISLPCSGKLDLLYSLKAFETGADGLMIVACEETACRYLEGSPRARNRAKVVDSLLEEIGLGKGRITVLQLPKGSEEKLRRAAEQFTEEIRNSRAAEAGAQNTSRSISE